MLVLFLSRNDSSFMSMFEKFKQITILTIYSFNIKEIHLTQV